MQNLTQKRVISEGARHKTGFSGFTFKNTIGGKYSNELAGVDRIKYGKIKDEIADGVELTRALLTVPK